MLRAGEVSRMDDSLEAKCTICRGPAAFRQKIGEQALPILTTAARAICRTSILALKDLPELTDTVTDTSGQRMARPHHRVQRTLVALSRERGGFRPTEAPF